MQYNFTPQPPRTPSPRTLSMIDGIRLFHHATGVGLSEAKFFIDTNLDTSEILDIVAVAKMIRAYYEHLRT